MPEHMDGLVLKLIKILKNRTPTLLGARSLKPFVDIKSSFTGVVQNWPSCFVLGSDTAWDDDGQQSRHGSHTVIVQLAITAGDPEELQTLSRQYVNAVDAAISASWPDYSPLRTGSAAPTDWAGTLPHGLVTRLLIRAHNYDLPRTRQGSHAIFPQVALTIETEETPQ